jgi:hypothetical protein
MAKMTMKKHPDEKEDKALIKKMMKASASKKPMASKAKPKMAKRGY